MFGYTRKMEIPHELSPELAAERIKPLLSILISDPEVQSSGEVISGLEEEWDGLTDKFRFKIGKRSVSGTITVEEKEIRIKCELPFLARLRTAEIEVLEGRIGVKVKELLAS